MTGWIVAGLVAAAWACWSLLRARTRDRHLARVERFAAGLAEGALEPPERAPRDVRRVTAMLRRLGEEHRARLGEFARARDERELVLAHMSDGVALLDAGGRVLQMNHRLAELLGAPRPARPGTPFSEFARVPELEELLEHARGGGATRETRLPIWKPLERVLRATATPLGAEAEAPALLVIQDLTEAERVLRMRQDFVANVSHELRTPLTSLRGYVETLLDGGLDDAENRGGFVQVIRDQTVRLQALVEDLLALAELERPDAVLRTETFDLRERARTQIAAVRELARRAGLEVVLEPGDPVPVQADRIRLEQALANLLDNAIKYTERGRVVVRLGSDAAHAWCEIEDTGAGIAAEHLARVFERFYRVDPARSRERGGTGLGLSIVRHIVELHGGRVSVRSEPGSGSTFRIEIPRAPEAGRRGPSRV